MVSQPKAIFLDMDGTVLNHHNQVTSNTVKVLDQLRAKGILVFIATGRSLKEIGDVAPSNLKVDGIVSANGMVATVGERTIVEHSLSNELIDEIIEKARKHKVYYEIHPNQGSRISLEQDKSFINELMKDPKPESVGINEWLSRKAAIEKDIKWAPSIGTDNYSKMYFFSRSPEHIQQWIDELEEIKKKLNFTTSTSSNHNVEVMVANINKATGIEHLMREFALKPADVIAIGDSNNDIPMLKLVGHAVAMKNASQEVKAIANEETAFTCDEDGVSDYLASKFQLNLE